MSGVHYDELAVTYGTMDALATELGDQAKKLEEDLEALKQAVLNVSQAGAARRTRRSRASPRSGTGTPAPSTRRWSRSPSGSTRPAVTTAAAT